MRRKPFAALFVTMVALAAPVVAPQGPAAAATPPCREISIATVQVGVACVQHNVSSVNGYIDRYVGTGPTTAPGSTAPRRRCDPPAGRHLHRRPAADR